MPKPHLTDSHKVLAQWIIPATLKKFKEALNGWQSVMGGLVW